MIDIKSKKLLIISLLALMLMVIPKKDLLAQVLAGKVINKDSREPIAFANIKLLGSNYRKLSIGVSANKKGEFTMAIKSFPVMIEITAVGHISKQMKLDTPQTNLIITLESKAFELAEFVVSGEKIEQEELRSPIQIEKLELAELRNTASFNFSDAVMNMKGVDVATQSIIINTVNARGFNSSTNQRFKQFTDGMDSQAPGLGFTLGNIVGANTLDVESLELIPGPTTSRFGQGVFNGVLDIKTKNPFEHQGLSFSSRGASIRLQKFDKKFFTFGDTFIHDLSVRYAKAFKDKVAFKVNFSRLAGEDFRARNYRNIGSGFSFQKEHSGENQGVDGINVYGDDRAAFVILPTVEGVDANGIIFSDRDTVFAVTRNGYREEDLVDYNAENIKWNSALHFKIAPETQLILAAFYGKASTVITGNDRIALRGFEITQYKAELAGKNFTIRGYTTSQNSGNTYNVGGLGESLVQTAKPDDVWFSQYERLYEFGSGTKGSLRAVRRVANSGFPLGRYNNRYEPGTEAFDSLRTAIISSQQPGFGAAIFDRSKAHYLDAQFTINEWDDFFENLIVGTNFRQYDPESNGTIFADRDGHDITNFEYGFFAEASKKISDKVELSTSFRVDKNENFNVVSSQRFSYLREFKPNSFLRASIQRGLRIPNIQEQFLDQNLGETRLIGGLHEIVSPYDLPNNAILESSLQEFNQAVADDINDRLRLDPDITGIDLSFVLVNIDAVRKDNLDIIENGIIGQNKFNGIKPERVTSFEIGYRSLVENKRVFEVLYYRNYYKDFIGNTRVIKPRTSPSLNLELATLQANSPATSDLFFITDNSDGLIITQGLELMYDVTSDQGTNFAINMTFADISQDSDDPLTPNFNTPPFKLNFTLGHKKLGKHVAAQLSWRFRSTYKWESPLADGTISDYHTLDFQLTYKLPSLNSSFRIGGNNVLNREQFNIFGGPEVSSYYYLSFTFDQF